MDTSTGENMKKILSEYQIGDMSLVYLYGKDRKGHEVIGITFAPLEMKNLIVETDDDIESLIQVKLIGDDYPFHYSQGRTMRNSESTFLMHFLRQYQEGQNIITEFIDDRRILYKHYIKYQQNALAIEIFCEIINQSQQRIQLEMLSSFTLGNLTPFISDEATETIQLHQIRSTWANEGRLVSTPIENLQLEPSWKPSGTNCIRYGQVGSMPNREYFPFIAIEDKIHNVTWACQLAIGSSWQLEAYRKDNKLIISGGIADREMGHWLKTIQPSENFITPKAILSVCQGDVNKVSQRITRHIQSQLYIHPCERDLPIIFNEFCTTWGNPSEYSIKKIAQVIQKLGIEYLVIDCGWYKQSIENNDSWNIQHGDWIFNRDLFPSGIQKLVSDLHDIGIKVGIWFEFESCGRESELFWNIDYLYKRDGFPITSGNRRFLNMCLPEVIDYLDNHLLTFLKDNHFDYLKVDYNANLGIGMDGYDSMGDSLFEGIQTTLRYLQKLKKELPELVIENCAAGGHRLVEPFLKVSDMSSFSDAHESFNIPIVAANMHRMIPIRQSQIWAVLHSDFSDRLLYYKLISTFLGRMCLSGDIISLSQNQMEIVQKAIVFYKSISTIIDNGESKLESHIGLSYKRPKGYQIVKRYEQENLLLIIHTFEESPKTIHVFIDDYELETLLSDSKLHITFDNHQITIKDVEDFDAIAIKMKRGK